LPLGDGARKFAKIQKFKNRKKIKNGGCSQIQKTQKRRLLSENSKTAKTVIALRKFQNSKIRKPQKRKNGGCSQKIPKFKLDDGWPESVEEQGLLLLVWRHNITNNI
jgi:hypothetical protein